MTDTAPTSYGASEVVELPKECVSGRAWWLAAAGNGILGAEVHAIGVLSFARQLQNKGERSEQDSVREE